MKVSALGLWLTTLACVLLGTAASGYYYFSLQTPPPTPQSPPKPAPQTPTVRGARGDEEPARPETKTGSPLQAERPVVRPHSANSGVLVLVLQTELLSKENEQAELVKELQAFKQKHGRRLLNGSIYLVNKEKNGVAWDGGRVPLRSDAAFASADIKEAFAACARVMRRIGATRTLLVWGCDIDPEMADVKKADLKLPRSVTLFWIGHADDSPWLRAALGKGSHLLRLDRDIRSLGLSMDDALSKEP